MFSMNTVFCMNVWTLSKHQTNWMLNLSSSAQAFIDILAFDWPLQMFQALCPAVGDAGDDQGVEFSPQVWKKGRSNEGLCSSSWLMAQLLSVQEPGGVCSAQLLIATPLLGICFSEVFGVPIPPNPGWSRGAVALTR